MTGKEDAGPARLHPLLGGAAVIVLLAVTVVAPWLRHHAAVIWLVLRDVTAVGLVTGAYWLIAATARGGARPVHRPAAADWFEKYRLDEPPPGPQPAPRPVPAEPQEGLAPVIPLRRPAQAEPEVTR